MSSLKDRVAIVTGAAQGIGATYAKALAAEGAKVMVTDILDPAKVVGEIKQAGGTAMGRIADVTKKSRLPIGAFILDIIISHSQPNGTCTAPRFSSIIRWYDHTLV